MAREIDYVNDDYKRLNAKWDIINDICNVENTTDYIEYLNSNDSSAANVARNKAYRNRAVFYELASFTRRGLLGLLFRKWPKLSIPNQISYIEKNIDGEGNSIYQQSQQLAKSVIGKGKAGLLVDYPPVDEEASQEDINTLRYVATVKMFEPEQILLPVETYTVGAEVKLKKVRLSTSVEEDGETIPVIRVLEIFEGNYWSSEYRESKEGWVVYSQLMVKDSSGKPLNEIPFAFVGAETNTKSENQPPMYGICKINIGHYNNSAAYEDSVHTVGQVQPWASGLTVSDVKEMEKEGMYFGSGRLIGVPDAQKLGFAQAGPNMIAKEAMELKVNIAVGLGGMFIQPGSAVKTATQSAGEQVVQHSVLSLIASNISEVYTTQILPLICLFMGVTPQEDMEYRLNQDFVDNVPDAQLFAQMLAGVMSGKVTQGALITWLQKMEIEDAEKTVEDIKEELLFESPETPALDLSGDE